MTKEKFTTEVETLENFFTIYCNNKHQNQIAYKRDLNYKGLSKSVELKLCEECSSLLNYSFDRLLECPHEEKPRCRMCPNPCYEKNEWKKVAKLMPYSGLKLGLLKIKKLFFS